MRTPTLLALIALAPVFAVAAPKSPEPDLRKVFAAPDRVRYDGHCLTLDGRDTFVYSAAFHYFRCPKELWRDRFRKIREAGFNTVETYVPWNEHERTMPAGLDDASQFDFTELKAWLKMAQEEFGFYTIVRPGPFICAEWGGGAYPRWLARFRPESVNGFWLRSADPDHIRWCLHWYDAVNRVFAEEQLTRKPKGARGIILVQLENEYNHHGCPGKPDVMRALYRSAKNAGIEVPLFTCLTHETRAARDPELAQVFDSDNYYLGLRDAAGCARSMAALRHKQPDAPGMVTELQGGWFSLVGGGLSADHYSDHRHYNAINLMTLLGGGTVINAYMFFGGTHFEGKGARGMTTSYDYNAPVRESGAVGPKYAVARSLGDFLRVHGDRLLHAEGGLCAVTGAPESVVGGVRVARDGTRFVFLHNNDPKRAASGELTVHPGKAVKDGKPVYNINQHGEKVLVDTAAAGSGAAGAPITVRYDLADLGARVLVIPPGADAAKGEWWPKPVSLPERPAALPAPVRITEARRIAEPVANARFRDTGGRSLTELGVNDCRYSLYRAAVTLDAASAARDTRLLLNSYARDIVTVRVNGKIAPRTFPADKEADAQSWPTRDCFKRIRADEYDNRFDLAGLLRAGENEIVAVYENLGHAHGYFPMEELAGIRHGGLGPDDKAVTRPLAWQAAFDLGGVTLGWTRPDADTAAWTTVKLDPAKPLPSRGRDHPKAERAGLVTWWRVDFELPAADPKAWVPWLARVRASGNGYMWLNGHNIGRHWEIGQQREFFLPECWLNFGPGKRNSLVFGLRETASGAVLEGVEIAPYPDAAEVR